MKTKAQSVQFELNLFQVHTFYGAACPSHQRYINLTGDGSRGSQVEMLKNNNNKEGANKLVIKVPCEPLHKYMSMSGLKAVDLFSLDVDGYEFEVLRTMNWKVPVGLFMIKQKDEDEDKKCIMQGIMKLNGYKKLEIPSSNNLNKFFIHPEYKKHILGAEYCL